SRGRSACFGGICRLAETHVAKIPSRAPVGITGAEVSLAGKSLIAWRLDPGRIGRARTCDGRQCRKPRLLRPHGPLGTGCFVSCLGGPTSGGNAMADVAKSSVVPTPVAARDSAAASAERSADAANRASAVVIGLFVLAVLYTCYFARA